MLLILTLLSFFSVSAINVSDYRYPTRAEVCEGTMCALQWIQDAKQDANVSQLPSQCPQSRFPLFIVSEMKSFESGRSSWEVLEASLKQFVLSVCHQCGLDDLFDHVVVFYQNLYFDFVRGFSSGYAKFLFFFSIFSLPSTIFLCGINLATLRRMLRESGGARYFHIAEVVTDMLVNVLVALSNLFVHRVFTIRYWRCFTRVRPGAFWSEAPNLLVTINQYILVALLFDRLRAVQNPVAYDQRQHAKRARNTILLIVVVSALVHAPNICYHAFYRGQSFVLSLLSTGIMYLIPLTAVVIQVFLAWRLRVTFNHNTNQSTAVDSKRKERLQKDNKLLLVGTVGLNLVCMCVSQLTIPAIWLSFFLGLGGFDTVSQFFYVLRFVLLFANGTLAIACHVWLCESYKNAFKLTWLGKVVCGKQVVRVKPYGGEAEKEQPNSNEIELKAMEE